MSNYNFDTEKQIPPQTHSKVIGCLSFLPILLGRNTSRFARLLRHNVIGKILLILGSGYIITIAMLYLFSTDVYPSTDSFKSLFDGNKHATPNAQAESSVDNGLFNPRAAVTAIKSTPTDKVSVFHWGDWIDLSEVKNFGKEGTDQSGFNWFAKPAKNIDDFTFPPKHKKDEKEQAFAGKLYLDRIARVPSRVIFVGEARSTYVVRAEDESRNHVDYSEQPERIETEEEKNKRIEREKKEKEEEEKEKKQEEEKKKKEEEEKKKKEEENKKKEEEKKKEEDENKKKQEEENKKKDEQKKEENKEDQKDDQKDDQKEEQNKDETQNKKREVDLDKIPVVSFVEPTASASASPSFYSPVIPTGSNHGKTAMEIFPPVIPALSTGTLEDKVAVTLPAELFTLDLARLQRTDENSTALELKHAAMIKKARKYVHSSAKHFHEVLLTNDPAGHGTHYDWRFFNLVRHGNEHEAVMHHLMRVWSMFTDQEGIASWISHGSLIGWYWNGFSMPWDSDNDVQMPIVEFDRFAQLYNGTLVVEDENEGTGRYYIDVGPWYVSRQKGNGFNVIDARFIDIRSGIYIDITGLSQTDRPNQFACKNNHYYHHDWLSPMRRTLYEGVEVYVPNMYEAVLKDEYKKYRQTAYKDWSFNRDLRLWVPTKKCAKFNVPALKFDSNEELNLYGACNDANIYKEYSITKDVSREHANEMDIYNRMDIIEKNGKTHFVDTDETRKLFANEFRTYYPPLRVDPGLSMNHQ